MLEKRLIGVITVKGGWAVQSIGYRRYLPLGRPEVLAENLDRWGADEIVLQIIDRSRNGLGPDFGQLERIARQGLSTPLIYAGGIRTSEDAVAAIAAGADRIVVDTLLHSNPRAILGLEAKLGAQAIVASLPISAGSDGCTWLDYHVMTCQPFGDELMKLLRSGTISEAFVIDWTNEGRPRGFDMRLIDQFPVQGLPLIAFGGLSEATQLQAVLERPNVVAAAIGNFLSYREHAIRHYKLQLNGVPMRAPSDERWTHP